ncbi:hypothetical protein ACPF8X_22370 [Streptomyces sp. G35A]
MVERSANPGELRRTRAAHSRVRPYGGHPVGRAGSGGGGTMRWLSAENLVAVATAILGIVASGFPTYLARGHGQDVIRTHGHLPCWSPQGLEPCARTAP